MAETKVTDKIDVDRMAAMLKLPSWESVEEQNVDYLADAYSQGRQQAVADELSEKEIEEAAQKAEEEAAEEAYRTWHGAVTSTMEQLLAEHKLRLEPIRKKATPFPWESRIVPASQSTWGDAARELAKTINGVGLTHEEASEYSKAPRQYVLTRLSWIRYFPEVYGSSSPERIYERSWR